VKNEILKQIINQVKKYDLVNSFTNEEAFKKWVSKLNSVQINNFLSLDISLEEVKNIKKLLINEDLLNCKDYKQKVSAILTLKNGDGCWHLFDAICKSNFLKSKNFYKDIEMLSKAPTARYGLWVIGDDSFINSPYHDEDLKLIVEAHNGEDQFEFLVSEALASVASNIDSIKSPYHREDMRLISKANPKSLQMLHSYPEQSMNNLAINKVSLSDKYHLENMKILEKDPIASEFLYIIMTEPKFVKGENYRKEVEVLVNAKTKAKARALYYYIVNPDRKYLSDMDYRSDYKYDVSDAYISDKNSVAGSYDPDYIDNLIKINEIDDKYVMHFVSLLMNLNFINSAYKNFDIELLQNTSDKKIFMDLYRLMSDEYFLNSVYHKNDAILISQTKNAVIRNLLLQLATNKYSLNSKNHEYDMEYASKLKLNFKDKELYEKICEEISYYLFRKQGIEDPKRIEKLESLKKGILVDRSNLANYLDSLETQINNDENEVIKTNLGIPKKRNKILSLFKKR